MLEIGKYYKINPKSFPYNKWRSEIDDAVKYGNQNWKCIEHNTLECSLKDSDGDFIFINFNRTTIDENFISPLLEFTGFKKGYYYRYWRSDNIYPSGFVNSIKPFFDGVYHLSTELPIIKDGEHAIFDDVPGGCWNYFSSNKGENFHEFYQEMSPEEYTSLTSNLIGTYSLSPWEKIDTSELNALATKIMANEPIIFKNNFYIHRTKVKRL